MSVRGSGGVVGVFYYCVDTTKPRDSKCESVCTELFERVPKLRTKF